MAIYITIEYSKCLEGYVFFDKKIWFYEESKFWPYANNFFHKLKIAYCNTVFLYVSKT